MLAEGVDPQTDRAGLRRRPATRRRCCSCCDELNLTLPRKIRKEAAGARGAGDAWDAAPVRGRDRPHGRRVRPHGQARRRRLLRVRGRQARAAVAGPAHASSAPPNHDVDLHELAERMLFVEALETLKCLDEGVLTSRSPTPTSARSSASASRLDRRRAAVHQRLPGRRGRLRGAGRRARREVRSSVHGARVAAVSCVTTFSRAPSGHPMHCRGRSDLSVGPVGRTALPAARSWVKLPRRGDDEDEVTRANRAGLV